MGCSYQIHRCYSPSQQMALNPIKTCVLGVGLAGLTFHVPFILALPELFTLHAVLERNPQTPGGKVKERFGVDTTIYRTMEQVINDREIDLVIVGTPNDTHYHLAKAALEAGKHVLVDKPVTETVAQADELGAIAKEKGLVLYGYQNRRWDSDHLALQRLLALPPSSPQCIGNILEFESHYDRYRPGLRASWKDGAGAVYDLGSHLLDQALNLFGRPARITAFVQNIRGVTKPEVDDTFTIYLHYNTGIPFSNPFTVLLRSHILSVKAPQLRYAIRGTKGVFTKHGLDPQEEQLKAMSSASSIFDPGYGQEPQEIYGTVENLSEDGVTVTKSIWPSGDPGQYIGLFKNLAGAVRNDEEMEVKWAQTTQVIEMIELAYRSSAEGRTLEVPVL
ncbi:NAD(P)-binding protein, partial [Gyrodon lividus]